MLIYFLSLFRSTLWPPSLYQRKEMNNKLSFLISIKKFFLFSNLTFFQQIQPTSITRYAPAGCIGKHWNGKRIEYLVCASARGRACLGNLPPTVAQGVMKHELSSPRILYRYRAITGMIMAGHLSAGFFSSRAEPSDPFFDYHPASIYPLH